MTIESEIKKPVGDVFRRVYAKRRLSTTGRFETSWQDITPYVLSYGDLRYTIDDIKLNRFTEGGVSLKVKNDTGFFNPETEDASFWKGYLTRYRTLVKIEAGYVQADGTELPTDPSLGIFVLDGEIEINAQKNEVNLNCISLMSVFEEVKATDLPNVTNSETASDVIAHIRDFSDGSGYFPFREFITSTSWQIQTTTQIYTTFNTTTSRDGMTTWELMGKLAEAEGYMLIIGRSGQFIFKDRNPNTTTSQFDLYGLGFPRPNVINIENFKEAILKYFNNVRMKWLDADTATSYINVGAAVSVNSSSPSWIYGQKVYEFENFFISSTDAASTIANTVFNYVGNMETEVNVTTKFAPQMEIGDRVTLSYHTYNPASTTVWDQFDWASDAATLPGDGGNWATFEKDTFDFNLREFIVISRGHNLDNFTTGLLLRSL